MSNNPKGYNGMRNQFGNMAGVPNLAGLQQPTPEQIQNAIGQRIQAMSVEMYMRAASGCLADPDMTPEAYAHLAAQSELAAMAYFVARGVITPKEPEPDDEADEITADIASGTESLPAAP